MITLSTVLPDDGRVINIPTNKQGCCPWPWSLVVLKDKIVVLGPGLRAQVLVNISVKMVNIVKRSMLRSCVNHTF